jgi:hypothetical protein
MGEHDDDLEPEVVEGEELESEHFPSEEDQEGAEDAVTPESVVEPDKAYDDDAAEI